MFPYLFPLASPSLPLSLSHPSRWSQTKHSLEGSVGNPAKKFLPALSRVRGGTFRISASPLYSCQQNLGDTRCLSRWGQCMSCFLSLFFFFLFCCFWPFGIQQKYLAVHLKMRSYSINFLYKGILRNNFRGK